MIVVLGVGGRPAIAATTPAPATQAGDEVLLTQPSHYLAGWGHGTVDCPAYTGRAWVFWQTYAVAVVGDRWALLASSRSLCRGSVKLARQLTNNYPNHLGATFNFNRGEQEVLTAAIPLHGGAHLLDGSPARGLKCYALPSSYAAGYEHELPDDQGDDEVAWTRAVGITASWVICLTGERRSHGKLTGVSYLTFGPLATDCALVHSIKADRPDPEDPTQMIPPTIEQANIWGDYSQRPCP